MTRTVEALRGREQQIQRQALEQIAVAARTVAAGGTTDIEVVGEALTALGKTSKDFDAAIELARRRIQEEARHARRPGGEVMSNTDPAVVAMKEATLSVYDVIAARGTMIRTGFVPQGRRKAIADTLAPFVPRGTTRDNVNAVALELAHKLVGDPDVLAGIQWRMDRAQQIRRDGRRTPAGS